MTGHTELEMSNRGSTEPVRKRLRKIVTGDRCAWGAGNRNGAIILEFLLVFPVVLVTTLAVFQFGILALVINAGTIATLEGAKAGSLMYPAGYPLNLLGDENDILDSIENRVNNILSLFHLEVGDGIVELQVTRGADGPFVRGSVAGYSPAPLDPIPGMVQVRICFPLIGAGAPIPNWLAPYGFTLENAKFEMTSLASLE